MNSKCILFVCIFLLASLLVGSFSNQNLRPVSSNLIWKNPNSLWRTTYYSTKEGASDTDRMNEQKYKDKMIKNNIFYADLSEMDSDQDEDGEDDEDFEDDDEESDTLLRKFQQKTQLKNDQEWMFFDVAKINAQGGEGGAGCMAMRREFRLEFGGPCGGNGGNGGSVYIECDETLNTLALLRRKVHHKGKDGLNGLGETRQASMSLPHQLGTEHLFLIRHRQKQARTERG